jgi:hypothetical protein
VAAFVAALAYTGRPEADVPNPATSEADPCLIVCPAGDSLFRVIVRDNSFNPLAGHTTEIDLCDCANVLVAPGGTSYDLVDGCIVRCLTDRLGRADFYLLGGGICSGASIEVKAYSNTTPLLLAIRSAMASPDQNGDLVVDTDDLAAVESKVGTSDPTADFDCDGSVTGADLAIAQEHLGHAAPTAVGVPDGRGFPSSMLAQNRPNPFSGRTRISFQLKEHETVTLEVFDLHGRQVAAPLRGVELGAGAHEIPFDGLRLATGIYIYRLRAGPFSASRPMVLFR